MNKLFKKNISISSHFFNKNKSHKSNIINSSIVINSRKMKDTYINRDSDKYFEFRYIDRFLNRFQSVLSSRIQIDIFIKHILHNNNSYKTKHGIGNKKYVFKKMIDSRAILYFH